MMIRRSLLRLALVGLFCNGQLTQAQTTPPVPAQASPATEALKGKIWTATARQIWADMKPKQTQPQPWATDEAFKTWRDKTPKDISGIGLLWGDVAKQVRTAQPASLKGQPATPAQVAQAILAEVERKQARDKAWGRLNVAALRTDLQKLVPLAAKPAPTAAAPATTPPAATSTTAAPVAATPTVAPAPPETTAAPTATTPPTTSPAPSPADSIDSSLLLPEPGPPAPSFIHQHPEQAMLGAGILGLLLGAVLMALLRGNRSGGRRARRPEDGGVTDGHVSQTDYLSEQELYWRNQNTELRKKIVTLERKITTLEEEAVEAVPAPAAGPATIAELLPLPSPEELAGQETESASPPVAVPTPPETDAPAARYGPVQETPFIEERKIVDTPLPQLALMLTPDPHNPDRASFTLNPQVNQTMLIGDGLTRLQKFFDYDPPVGRITTVTAAAPGQLQRQGDGWQVMERARLLIR